jgi:hypothetical protein
VLSLTRQLAWRRTRFALSKSDATPSPSHDIADHPASHPQEDGWEATAAMVRTGHRDAGCPDLQMVINCISTRRENVQPDTSMCK